MLMILTSAHKMNQISILWMFDQHYCRTDGVLATSIMRKLAVWKERSVLRRETVLNKNTSNTFQCEMQFYLSGDFSSDCSQSDQNWCSSHWEVPTSSCKTSVCLWLISMITKKQSLLILSTSLLATVLPSSAKPQLQLCWVLPYYHYRKVNYKPGKKPKQTIFCT